jgi:hypothetical protein
MAAAKHRGRPKSRKGQARLGLRGPATSARFRWLKRVREWFSRPAKLLTSIALALAIATGLIFRDAVLSQLFDKNAIEDSVREVRGDPDLAVRVEHHSGNIAFVRADDYKFSPSEERVLEDLTNPDAAPLVDRARSGGVSVDGDTWLVYLHGNRNRTIRVLDIRPISIKRGAPLTGTLVDIEPQGGSVIPGVWLDMNSPFPEVHALRDDGTTGKPYFNGNTISLTDQEDQVLGFHVWTTRYSVSFELEIDYRVGDERRSQIITDNGKSFVLTGLRCHADATPDYKRYYEISGEGHLGLFPKALLPPDSRCRLP